MQLPKRHIADHNAPAGSDPTNVKPLLRGWSHALAALAAIVVTIGLLLQTHDDLWRFVSLLIFGISMIELYLFSAIYHIGPWKGRSRRILRAIDHANIFLLIAGTFTPICVIVLTGWLQTIVLCLVWTLAVVGVLGEIIGHRFPRWATTIFYLSMGAVAFIPLPRLAHLLPWQAIAMLASGGVLYTIGAVVYAVQRPNPLPRFFGFHEIFHLFTIGGGAAFIIVIWRWVVPFSPI